MRRAAFLLAAFMSLALTGRAVDNNVVQVVWSGTAATVTVADNISQYVSVSTGASSHVVITQSSDFAGVDATADNEDGEIFYVLSGTSADGSLTLNGSYKCEIDLNGLTLTNTSGPAFIILNGKRIAISAKKGTTNSLADAANTTYKGCIHVKGHTKLKGKGTLNVTGNSAHGIWSKEYIEVKNITLNITAAQKDGIHCREYFLQESGTVSISGAGDDGIQVELDDEADSTGATTGHEDENSGNFYMEDGTLTISGYGSKAVKTDGTITWSGGTWNFNTADVTENAASGIGTVSLVTAGADGYYDLLGRPVEASQAKGLIIVKNNGQYNKVIIK